jgi:hypothetical protein
MKGEPAMAWRLRAATRPLMSASPGLGRPDEEHDLRSSSIDRFDLAQRDR